MSRRSDGGSRRPIGLVRARASSAIVFVVDGLGARNLAARAGHARFLSQPVEEGHRPHRLPQHDRLRTHEPAHRESSRAARHRRLPRADPGHRRGREPAPRLGHRRTARSTGSARPRYERRDRASSCPSPSTPAPASPRPPRAAPSSTPPTTSPTRPDRRRPRGAASGILRVRVRARLDAIGHKRGWQSDEWVAALEKVDAAARALDGALARGHRPRRHGRPRHGGRSAAPARPAGRRRPPRRRRPPHRRRAADAAPVRRARGRASVSSTPGAKRSRRGHG